MPITQICPTCAQVFSWRLGAHTKGKCSICGSTESYDAINVPGISERPLMGDKAKLRLEMEVYWRQYGEDEFYRRYPPVH